MFVHRLLAICVIGLILSPVMATAEQKSGRSFFDRLVSSKAPQTVAPSKIRKFVVANPQATHFRVMDWKAPTSTEPGRLVVAKGDGKYTRRDDTPIVYSGVHGAYSAVHLPRKEQAYGIRTRGNFQCPGLDARGMPIMRVVSDTSVLPSTCMDRSADHSTFTSVAEWTCKKRVDGIIVGNVYCDNN